MTTAYSQRDTEWSTEPLGHQETPTMGQAGCLVTAVASVVTDLTDQPMAPGYLNDWLRKNKGFSNGNLFVFASITSLGLQLVKMIPSSSQPAPITELAELLAGGAALVVLVDSTPGGTFDNHWVRLLAVDEKDGQIMDPWQLPGREFVPLSAYFASGWTPARAIFNAAVYRPKEPATRGLRGLESGVGEENEWENSPAYQTSLCIRPEE